MKNLASHFRRKIVAALLSGASLLLAQSAYSHGYLVNSRADLCHSGKNSNCGPIQWEPQSVEGGDRYPEAGPSDGTLASAGNTGFSQLNEQSRGRWSKVAMKSGAQTLQWQFTAPHSSRDIRYWITKADWDPNAPLSRAQFETQPFCQVQYGNAKPVPSTAERANHYCNVPQRTGYHIILSVWDVADTVNSFYSVLDANFDSSVLPAFNQVGTIFASTDLPVGATASTRVFTQDGESAALSTSIKINTATEGLANKWPRLLATAINEKNLGLQAGVMEGSVVTPADGVNNIYTTSASAITRVEIATKMPVPDPIKDENNFGISKLSATALVKGKTQLNLSVFTTLTQTVDIKLANKTKDLGVIYHQDNLTGAREVAVPLSGLTAGQYDVIMLVSFLKNSQKQILQKKFTINIAGELPVALPYPTGKGSYVAGSRVTGTNGVVYACKPWPYTAWCNGVASYYEPGKGLAWSQAWDVSK